MLMKYIYFNTFSFNSYYVALNSVRLFMSLKNAFVLSHVKSLRIDYFREHKEQTIFQTCGLLE